MMNTTEIMISCLACQQTLCLDPDLSVGQEATCPSCHTDFVVTWLFPISLDFIEPQDQILACQVVGSERQST